MGISAKEALDRSIRKLKRSGKDCMEESPSISPPTGLADDLRTFEQKYDVINEVLGEGCASVVKEVIKIEEKPSKSQKGKIKLFAFASKAENNEVAEDQAEDNSSLEDESLSSEIKF